MRRTQHRELLAIVNTLIKVHDEIRKCIEANRIEIAQNLLAECQNCAISIGEVIEAEEGENCEAIKSLEEYCETVYQIHSQIIDGIEAAKAAKVLKKKLLQVENSIRNHIPVQIKILFLPYKRAMWDSMESVWQAACNDPMGSAVVMPIPYFDKNVDGSLGEMHDESGDFEIPIVHWKSYDIEMEHPDVIVVHNPYDKYNHVTTIYPHFYMSNLKKWTDKLVYIPYFIHQNDMVKSHYCVLPGTMYSDLVVLQSEETKKQYIRYFEQETGIKEGLEKRFQALGAPKLDIPQANNEDAVRREWDKIIYKNGIRRKVIFLNTHLSCVMRENQENFFKKIEEIFKAFKNNDNVVLLWRPHPLTVPTAKSMNPDAVKPYLDLIKRFKEEEIGILDETTDFRRAVDVADACYGSASSVVEVFRAMRKPVMCMNIELHKGDNV